MLCTVLDICGDYALIRRDASGAESEVAMFLLPDGIKVGTKLLFQDFEYTIV